MAPSSQQRTQLNLTTSDGRKRGSVEFDLSSSNLTFQGSIQLPVIPKNESDRDTSDTSQNSPAARNPNANSESSESSESIPLFTPPQANPSETTNSDTSASQEPDSDQENQESSTAGAALEQSNDSNLPANEDTPHSTTNSVSEPQETTEAKDETESRGASSDNTPQQASSECPDTSPSSNSPSTASGSKTKPESDDTETETKGESECSEELSGSAKSTLIPSPLKNQEELKSWISDRQKGEAQIPNQSITQIELVSWLQVPEILRALSNDDGPLRITYPDCGNQSITVEQQAIREFLVQGAGRDLTDLIGELKEKIRACHFVESGIVTAALAEQYRSSITVENSSSTKLTVAEVIRTNEHFAPNKGDRKASMASASKRGRNLILGAITTTMTDSSEFHTLIIEVPEEHCNVAKWAFARHYNKLDENKPDTQHAKVWVIPSPGGTKEIEESSFLDFIDGAPDMEPKKKRPNAAKQTSTSRPKDQVLSNEFSTDVLGTYR